MPTIIATKTVVSGVFWTSITPEEEEEAGDVCVVGTPVVEEAP
jgi:hypothetical protein